MHGVDTLGNTFDPSSAKGLAQPDFLLGKTEGEGTLGTQRFNSVQINATQSPVGVSKNSFSHDIARILATGEDMDRSPLIALIEKPDLTSVTLKKDMTDLPLSSPWKQHIKAGSHSLKLPLALCPSSIGIWVGSLFEATHS